MAVAALPAAIDNASTSLMMFFFMTVSYRFHPRKPAGLAASAVSVLDRRDLHRFGSRQGDFYFCLFNSGDLNLGPGQPDHDDLLPHRNERPDWA
jgi:hypothetical protein